MAAKKISRVLIVNRGEIAVRIIRTLRELGKESVAIYSDADKDSKHRFMADQAVRLPGRTPADTYLNIPKIIDAIKRSKADAVHPGYGFLSENDEFCRKVTELGVTFIGPSPESMQSMGDKITARAVMEKNNVPTVPGSPEALGSLKDLTTIAESIGFPVIIKAAHGGGGRGMRVVNEAKDLKAAYEGCTREAQAYFGNPEVFVEKYMTSPRHIEFQILRDRHGNGVSAGLLHPKQKIGI